jgi:glycosyltransferase involved in cell wall biosynthesis
MRKRVLVVYDSVGWSFHRIAGQVHHWLSDEFDVYTTPYWPAPKQLPEVDMVCFLGYVGVHQVAIPDDVPIVVCVYDQHIWRSQSPQRDWMMQAARRSSMLLAASPHLVEIMTLSFPESPLGTCYDGVNTDLFQPQPLRERDGKLRVGWCGNADAKHHGDLKGLHLIREAVDAHDFAELVVGDRTDHWTPHELMPHWYADVDVYVCMSECEGTPNPILEASACARPWVSTDVGIVNALHESTPKDADEEPGLIIKRSADDLADVLTCMRYSRSLQAMGQAGRAAIENGWSWQDKAEQFRRAFRMVLCE